MFLSILAINTPLASVLITSIETKSTSKIRLNQEYVEVNDAMKVQSGLPSKLPCSLYLKAMKTEYVFFMLYRPGPTLRVIRNSFYEPYQAETIFEKTIPSESTIEVTIDEQDNVTITTAE